MDVQIVVPDEVARQLEARWGGIPRRALEALAADAYRTGVLTHAEVQSMLGFHSGWQVDEFLKQAHAYLDYSEADLERDLNAIRQVSAP